jgi:dUTP pyrophosphatase
MKVKIYRINKNNPLPTRANKTDAGWDVYASESNQFIKGDTELMPLGIIAEAPEGYHFKLVLRSSMAFREGFRLANGVGIIDSSYCGPRDEIKMLLEWNGSEGYGHIEKGQRIGQLILEKNCDFEWDEQDDQDFSKESRGGFGSSGK